MLASEVRRQFRNAFRQLLLQGVACIVDACCQHSHGTCRFCRRAGTGPLSKHHSKLPQRHASLPGEPTGFSPASRHDRPKGAPSPL